MVERETTLTPRNKDRIEEHTLQESTGAQSRSTPVTGSAHTTLIPYWAKKLGRKTLFARQISARTGELWCEDCGERVAISGQCVPFMQGTITL